MHWEEVGISKSWQSVSRFTSLLALQSLQNWITTWEKFKISTPEVQPRSKVTKLLDLGKMAVGFNMSCADMNSYILQQSVYLFLMILADIVKLSGTKNILESFAFNSTLWPFARQKYAKYGRSRGTHLTISQETSVVFYPQHTSQPEAYESTLYEKQIQETVMTPISHMEGKKTKSFAKSKELNTVHQTSTIEIITQKENIHTWSREKTAN